MMQRLLPGMSPGSPPHFFAGRLHEFLTCRAIAKTLDGKMLDNTSAQFFEELALKCMLRAMASSKLELWQLELLFEELPSILPLKYPVVGEIKKTCLQLMPQMMMQYRLQSDWVHHNRCDYLMRLLKGI